MTLLAVAGNSGASPRRALMLPHTLGRRLRLGDLQARAHTQGGKELHITHRRLV